MRIAVIGAGISGNTAAYLLSGLGEVTVFEAAARPGGHSNTVSVETPAGPVPVDTGFIVYNTKNYPNLIALFDRLGVATQPSDMSFAVSLDDGRVEYGTSTLSQLYTQKTNAFSPGFQAMVWDILRFFRLASKQLPDLPSSLTLGEWLKRERFGRRFSDDHLLPMAAAIWSSPQREILDFPVKSFLTFYRNHGLLTVDDRPDWRTVTGGSREYVAKLTRHLGDRLRLSSPARRVRRDGNQVIVVSEGDRAELFDHVVFACHGDEALALIADPDREEREILSCFRFQPNEAVLHSDEALMPRRRAAWSSWNYIGKSGAALMSRSVAVTYWMNKLQDLDPAHPIFVTLNPLEAPKAELVHGRFHYDHPIFDRAALDAQARMPEIQGRRGLWFCGAYLGYGFHEDGVRSAMNVARGLGAFIPWATQPDATVPPYPAAAMDAAD